MLGFTGSALTFILDGSSGRKRAIVINLVIKNHQQVRLLPRAMTIPVIIVPTGSYGLPTDISTLSIISSEKRSRRATCVR